MLNIHSLCTIKLQQSRAQLKINKNRRDSESRQGEMTAVTYYVLTAAWMDGEKSFLGELADRTGTGAKQSVSY